MVKEFKKRPNIIEAIQFIDDKDVILQIFNFIGEHFIIKYNGSGPYFTIKTFEGEELRVNEGDWIMKDVNNKFFVKCSNDFDFECEPLE
jgi:hypothetical protein